MEAEERLPQFLTSPATARRLGLAPGTLRKWRRELRGPAFVRLGGPRGRVLYAVAEVEAWLTAQTNSTPRGDSVP